MRNPSAFYITTAIDYPNNLPHIGTAFEKIGADAQARYRRMEGRDVWFQMGNDENTIKVSQRAAELGKEPKPYADEMAAKFQEVWDALEISRDGFIQTSDPHHHEGCRKFIQKVFDAGDIYKKNYTGLYCNGCEAFKTDKEVEEGGGRCPAHPNQELKQVEEENYFFRLSAYQDRLLALYRERPEFIQPESRRNEITNLVESGLQDVAITRKGFTWGIKVPFDEEQTIYVWFDALLNYITAIGYGWDEERFRKYWPADVHVIGKDITRFHCALWPAMLWSAGLEIPQRVFAHGFVYADGAKVSKSGVFIDPRKLGEQHGPDAVRYYFLRECPFGGDGRYSDDRFAEVYNADLANYLGNLYSRTISMCVKYFDGRLEGLAGADLSAWRPGLDLGALVADLRGLVESFQYNVALQRIWQDVLVPANGYITATEPFKLIKTDPDATRLVLANVAEAVRVTGILLKPFLPAAAAAYYGAFDFGSSRPWESVNWDDVAGASAPGSWAVTAPLLPGGKLAPLFPKIEPKPKAE